MAKKAHTCANIIFIMEALGKLQAKKQNGYFSVNEIANQIAKTGKTIDERSVSKNLSTSIYELLSQTRQDRCPYVEFLVYGPFDKRFTLDFVIKSYYNYVVKEKDNMSYKKIKQSSLSKKDEMDVIAKINNDFELTPNGMKFSSNLSINQVESGVAGWLICMIFDLCFKQKTQGTYYFRTKTGFRCHIRY